MAIDTLVEDIQGLFTNGSHEANPERVEAFGQRLAKLVAARLAEDRSSEGPGRLRMSNLGKPDRQLWYETHRDQSDKEQLEASQFIKFMFGDIIELLLLFLAEESGHEVTHLQEKVTLNGIDGSADAVIDGVVVDVKSASSQAFNKFKYGTLKENDGFGYYDQIAGYSAALGIREAAFLAMDKQLGHLALLRVSSDELDAIGVEQRIEHIKEVVANDELPPRCYDPEPEGTSGNLKLSVGCSYCPFKFECWSDANDGIGLRTFIYSQGPKHLVHVEREPKVPEVTF